MRHQHWLLIAWCLMAITYPVSACVVRGSDTDIGTRIAYQCGLNFTIHTPIDGQFNVNAEVMVNLSVVDNYGLAGQTCTISAIDESDDSTGCSITGVTSTGADTYRNCTWIGLDSNTVYNWHPYISCTSIDDTGDSVLFSTEGYEGTQQDTAGECLTGQGYKATYTKSGANIDWVTIDFSDLSIVRENGTNIESDYPFFNQGDTDTLLADVRNIQTFDFYIGGDNMNNTWPDNTNTSDETFEVVYANLTLENNFYNITMKWENDSTQWDYLAATSQALTVLCDDYAPDTIDLDVLNLSNFYIATKQPPKLEFKTDNDLMRVYESDQDTEDILVFNLNKSMKYETINYTLEDYVGDYGNSMLRIVRNINATLQTIWQERWYHLEVLKVDLQNNTYYQYVIYTPDETRIIAWDYIDGSVKNKVITITQPTYTGQLRHQQNCTCGFTSSYSGGTVGVAYNITAGTFTNISFYVYNYSNSQYEHVYNTSVVGGANSGSITYSVSDNNASYYVKADMYCSEVDSVIGITDLLSPYLTEERVPYYDAFNLPTTILGISKEKVYDGISMFFVTGTAMMFTGLEVGVGGLITVGVIGMLKYFGWFRSMSWELFYFLMAMAMGIFIVSRRRKTE
jgi:hypothetical protein